LSTPPPLLAMTPPPRPRPPPLPALPSERFSGSSPPRQSWCCPGTGRTMSQNNPTIQRTTLRHASARFLNPGPLPHRQSTFPPAPHHQVTLTVTPPPAFRVEKLAIFDPLELHRRSRRNLATRSTDQGSRQRGFAPALSFPAIIDPKSTESGDPWYTPGVPTKRVCSSSEGWWHDATPSLGHSRSFPASISSGNKYFCL
jgi:hypothetical protein